MQPDWVLMWGWGVMNQVAVKEASSIRYPMDRFIGNWWAGSEHDVTPAGEGANGYLSATFHAPGADFPLHQEILEKVYDADMGAGDRDRVGEVLYNRGLVAAVWTAEAIRKAMEIKGSNEIVGKDVREGLEALNVTEERLGELGLPELHLSGGDLLRGSLRSGHGADPAVGCGRRDVARRRLRDRA